MMALQIKNSKASTIVRGFGIPGPVPYKAFLENMRFQSHGIVKAKRQCPKCWFFAIDLILWLLVMDDC